MHGRRPAVASTSLQHERHSVPVTALAILEDGTVLGGEGNLLVAYDPTSGARIASWRAFERQTIHGVARQRHEEYLLVWGGPYIRQISTTSPFRDRSSFCLGQILDAGDWILDVALSPPSTGHGDGVDAVLITAHNALSLVIHVQSVDKASEPICRLVPLIAGSNCILYAAHAKWMSASRCLVASGTAFGDIIVWSCHILHSDQGLDFRSQIHHTFSAHEGSVFGVRLSGLTRLPDDDKARILLASCSDDRTIRIWDISDMGQTWPALTDEVRDTGFGPKLTASAKAPPCLAKALAHISRIWSVRFLNNSDFQGDALDTQSSDNGSSSRYLLSFGEDATMIMWTMMCNINRDGSPSLVLQQKSIQSAHSGKNLWSTVFTRSGCVVTGGADGSIVISQQLSKRLGDFSIGRVLSLSDSASRTWSFRAYAFMSHDTLIATSEQGSVHRLTVSGEDEASGEELHPPQAGLKGYSIVSASRSMGFIAGKDGPVWVYWDSTKEVVQIANILAKVAGIFVAQASDESVTTVLVTCVGSALGNVIALASGRNRASDCLQSKRQVKLPGGYIATSFECATGNLRDIVLVGCRNGAIILYAGGPGESLQELALVSNAHGQEAVTSIHYRQNASGGGRGFYVYSTGRDGTIAVHRADFDADDVDPALGRLSTRLVHQVTLPFGPNVEGMGFSAQGHVWTWGFRSKHFVVHDVTAEREIMTVECGGAHRNWAFQPEPEGGVFCWTKASKLYKQRQREAPYRTLQHGGHGREVKAVAVSTQKPARIATGAEDTDIKLYSYTDEHGFRCTQTLRKHNTGVQHLQWSGDNRHLFSSGGFEEFFVWRVTAEVPGLGIGVTCESRHPLSNGSDLRIMGFCASATSGEDGDGDGDGDGEAHYSIAMAYSDSTLRLWSYRAGTWRLMSRGDYLTACLTQVHRLGPGERLITTATDGYVACWRGQMGSLSWTGRHKVHQNAILEAVVVQGWGHEPATTLVVTAGDDNAIAVSLVAEGGREMETVSMPRAHSAAVTALAAVPSEDGLWLVSASVDQRVKLWEIQTDAADEKEEGVRVRIRRLASVHTAVADVACVRATALEDGGRGVVVCGVGMEMLRLAHDDDDDDDDDEGEVEEVEEEEEQAWSR